MLNRDQWITSCEDQIASISRCMAWTSDDEELFSVLQSLTDEWMEAVTS